MKTVAQKINDAIHRKGFSTVKECAQTLGLPYELLRKVVGEDHIPKDGQLLVYAKKLGIDPKDLLFTAYHQKAPSEFKEYFETKVIRESPRPTNKIPVINWQEAGSFFSGINKAAKEASTSEFLETNLMGANLFAMRIADGSMKPLFNEGDFIIVDADAHAKPGDYVVIDVTMGEASLRQLKKFGSTVILHPTNLKFEDIEMTKPMKIIGRVIRLQRDF